MQLGVQRGLGIGSLAALLITGTAAGDAGDPVVTVGKEQVAASTVARALARTSPRERQAWGASPGAAGANFVSAVLVPELLLAEHARRTLPRAAQAEREALARALLESLERSVPPANAAQVAEYHAAHLGDFHEPETLRIWRIVVKDATLARTIIAQGRGAKGPEQWRLAAREHSLDDATKYRSGDLGFVRADGTTTVPQLQIDPEVFRAASQVKDGEIVPEPVAHGDTFAVIWRRGTRAASNVSSVDATDGIRRALRHRDFAAERDRLIASLRKSGLREEHPELLELLPLEAQAAELPAPANLSAAPRGSAAPPTPTERGLR